MTFLIKILKVHFDKIMINYINKDNSLAESPKVSLEWKQKSEKERMNQLNQAIKEVTNLREESTSNKSANLKSPSGGMPPQPPAPSRGGSNGNYPVAPKNLRPNYMQQLAGQPFT